MSKQKDIETDIIGKKFGRLTVKSYDHKEKRKNGEGYNHYYSCICDCGNECIVGRNQIKYGNTQSCGCIRSEQLAQRNKETGVLHGDSVKHKRLYHIYNGMKERCYSTQSKSYKYYGAKGITICEQWLNDWNSFKEWSLNNGYTDDLTIDRIDVNGIYEPNNCRWVDNKTQANNKTDNKYLTYKGETKTLAEWCDELKLPYHTIKARLNKLGMSVEEAFETPKQWNEYKYGEGVTKVGNKIYLTYNNKTLSINEWLKELNLDYKHEFFAVRARKGWSAKEIIETPKDESKVRNFN